MMHGDFAVFCAHFEVETGGYVPTGKQTIPIFYVLPKSPKIFGEEPKVLNGIRYRQQQ
jgi:hypothetical protein